MSAEMEGRDAAGSFRREHELGTQPLGDLVALIEQTTGIDVAVLDAGPDEHGLTMRDPERGAVFIAVARTRNPMRQRSTLAHELAHVVFEDWTDTANLSVNSPVESRANSFARHLLVPVAGVKEVVGRGAIDLSTLSRVVQRFEVSPYLAAIALEQAGYIGSATKDEWKQIATRTLATRFGWADQYRALQAESDQRRAPQKLLTRATTGYVENVVSAQTIATLRNMDVGEVENELRTDGIEPREAGIAWAAATDLPDSDIDLGDWGDEEPEGSAG
ncbi:ImmA/IrrE family metallo-endopeptidase [Rhodococcus sp. NPDC019627]|uniref:ImmA/IrrE family metallo-endopeptidase n=1 Tax=unclassified Rhodococcus (in: high G+C Gram-positive bacteria) TaxID=192944 RepID=UPI0033FB0640